MKFEILRNNVNVIHWNVNVTVNLNVVFRFWSWSHPHGQRRLSRHGVKGGWARRDAIVASALGIIRINKSRHPGNININIINMIK